MSTIPLSQFQEQLMRISFSAISGKPLSDIYPFVKMSRTILHYNHVYIIGWCNHTLPFSHKCYEVHVNHNNSFFWWPYSTLYYSPRNALFIIIYYLAHFQTSFFFISYLMFMLSLNDLVVKTYSSSPKTIEKRQCIYKNMILH